MTQGTTSHAEINVGFYGTAYVVRHSHEESITNADAKLIAKYWLASQHFYDSGWKTPFGNCSDEPWKIEHLQMN